MISGCHWRIVELPPRTRRIPQQILGQAGVSGTTSAHAENTRRRGCQKRKNRNYLRARGEYLMWGIFGCQSWELPPRTRRILAVPAVHGEVDGTTSAHAENTLRQKRKRDSYWNYLRARGEYFTALMRCRSTSELPPRTRRILAPFRYHPRCTGTTSAHAENTHGDSISHRRRWNYLRARGEYRSTQAVFSQIVELPPRTRRIPAPINSRHCSRGTTSAHAENTPNCKSFRPPTRNYLRARGEYPK